MSGKQTVHPTCRNPSDIYHKSVRSITIGRAWVRVRSEVVDVIIKNSIQEGLAAQFVPSNRASLVGCSFIEAARLWSIRC